MTTANSIERRFEVLCEIVRAQHFAWREAVREKCPEVDPGDVAKRMWEIVGAGTARSYSRRIDTVLPVAEQIAARIVHSSRCMGEEATVEPGEHSDEAYVRHTECPWCDWHDKLGLIAEDRPGCDKWFGATLDKLGESIGAKITFETLQALPEGDESCLRRIRVE